MRDADLRNIYWAEDRKSYRVGFMVDRKHIRIGSYSSYEEARLARDEWYRENGVPKLGKRKRRTQ